MIRWLWNERENVMALADISRGLPLIAICDDEYKDIEPFHSYPMIFLKHYGWVDLGEMK